MVPIDEQQQWGFVDSRLTDGAFLHRERRGGDGYVPGTLIGRWIFSCIMLLVGAARYMNVGESSNLH